MKTILVTPYEETRRHLNEMLLDNDGTGIRTDPDVVNKTFVSAPDPERIKEIIDSEPDEGVHIISLGGQGEKDPETEKSAEYEKITAKIQEENRIGNEMFGSEGHNLRCCRLFDDKGLEPEEQKSLKKALNAHMKRHRLIERLVRVAAMTSIETTEDGGYVVYYKTGAKESVSLDIFASMVAEDPEGLGSVMLAVLDAVNEDRLAALLSDAQNAVSEEPGA